MKDKEYEEFKLMVQELERALRKTTKRPEDWKQIEEMAEHILRVKHGRYLPAYGALREAAQGNKNKLIAVYRRVRQYFPENIDATIFLAEQTDDITKEQLENVKRVIEDKLEEVKKQAFTPENSYELPRRKRRLENRLNRVNKLLSVKTSHTNYGVARITELLDNSYPVFKNQDFLAIAQVLKEGEQLEAIDLPALAEKCLAQNSTPGLICGLTILKLLNNNPKIDNTLKKRLQGDNSLNPNNDERELIEMFRQKTTITFIDWRLVLRYFNKLTEPKNKKPQEPYMNIR